MTEAPQEGSIKLPVKPKKQNRVWNCGPTALFTALRYQYGLPLTLNELDVLAGGTENGADEYNMVRALILLGFRYRQRDDGTVYKLRKCLEMGQAPIVHMVMEDGVGHYRVVSGIDEQNILLADPANGQEVTYGLAYFIGCWRVGKEDPAEHWYLVVTGHTGDKLGALINKLKRIQRKIQKARS